MKFKYTIYSNTPVVLASGAVAPCGFICFADKLQSVILYLHDHPNCYAVNNANGHKIERKECSCCVLDS